MKSDIARDPARQQGIVHVERLVLMINAETNVTHSHLVPKDNYVQEVLVYLGADQTTTVQTLRYVNQRNVKVHVAANHHVEKVQFARVQTIGKSAYALTGLQEIQ